MTSPGAEGPSLANRARQEGFDVGHAAGHAAGYAQAIKDMVEAIRTPRSQGGFANVPWPLIADLIERRFSAPSPEASGSVASYEHGAGSALSGKGAGAHDAPSGTTPGPDSQPASPETERAEDGC